MTNYVWSQAAQNVTVTWHAPDLPRLLGQTFLFSALSRLIHCWKGASVVCFLWLKILLCFLIVLLYWLRERIFVSVGLYLLLKFVAWSCFRVTKTCRITNIVCKWNDDVTMTSVRDRLVQVYSCRCTVANSEMSVAVSSHWGISLYCCMFILDF